MSENVLREQQTDPPVIVYSTADIERVIFYGEQHDFLPEQVPEEDVQLTVVNGEIFRLEEQSVPPGFARLTEESGLFRLIDEASSPRR